MFHQWLPHNFVKHLLWASLSLKLQWGLATLIPWTFNIASYKPSQTSQHTGVRHREADDISCLTTTETVWEVTGGRTGKCLPSYWCQCCWKRYGQRWKPLLERWKWEPRSVARKKQPVKSYSQAYVSPVATVRLRQEEEHCIRNHGHTWSLVMISLGYSTTAISATSTQMRSLLIGWTNIYKFSALPHQSE